MALTLTALTLEKLLAEARNDQIKCVAGFKGLSRLVLDTNIIDSPEILAWLKGGELVMTTGYVLSNNRPMIRTIVRDLVNKDCAGLAFKTKRYFDEIPQIILDQGNELDFPILELSYDMRMSDLARFVYSNIFRNELSTQEQTYRLYNHVTKALISDKDISLSLYEISKHIQNPLFLVDSGMNLVAYELPENIPGELLDYVRLELGAPLLAEKALKDTLSLYHMSRFRGHTLLLGPPGRKINLPVFALEMNDENLGFLCLLETNATIHIDHFRLIEGIIPVLCIHILKNTFSRAPSVGDKNGFVKKVLLNPQVTENIVKQYSHAFGFQHKLKRVCLVIQIADFLSLPYSRRNVLLNSTVEQIDQILSGQGQPFYATQYEDKFIYFLFSSLSTGDDQALDTALDMAGEMEATLQNNPYEDEVTFHIGVSDCSIAWEGIPKTYARAVNAIELGKKICPDRVVHSYAGNLTYHILNDCLSPAQLTDLYTCTVAALDVYDSANNASLMMTLEAYCEQNYNRSKTAAALYIHRNTLFYRLDKIAEILRLDLNDAENLHNLLLGIRAKKLLDATTL